jgi:hypothetical protein
LLGCGRAEPVANFFGSGFAGLGVNTKRVRQIEATALLKLRRWFARNSPRFKDVVGG